MASCARISVRQLGSGSSFVWQNYAKNGHKEPAAHIKARLRVGNIGRKAGQVPDYKKAIQLTPEWTVYPDIFFQGPVPTDTELDGDSHETTEQKHLKDINRDKALAALGVRTVRLSVRDVNGWILNSGKYFRLTDAEIYVMVFK